MYNIQYLQYSGIQAANPSEQRGFNTNKLNNCVGGNIHRNLELDYVDHICLQMEDFIKNELINDQGQIC